MNSNTVKILAFDPGNNKAGWAFIIHDHKKDHNTVRNFGTFEPNKEAKKKKEDVKKFTQQIVTLAETERIACELILKYKPELIVSEEAFFNPKRPNAYAPLVLWIGTIASACYTKFKKTLYRIAARTAKVQITGKGNSNKFTMQEAVKKCSNIEFKTKQKRIDSMSEHAADAIGVGVSFTKLYPEVIKNVIELKK